MLKPQSKISSASNHDKNCIIIVILIKESIIRIRTSPKTQRKSRSIEGVYTSFKQEY